ncbi:MAG: PA14 domain-containing protein [Planctomycetes bacterium]|nr:PA14 domain-containing protein [Planctomycetota bacterium]
MLLALGLAALCHLGGRAEPLGALDPAFAAWLRDAPKTAPYEEIATRFLEAAGRDPAAYRASLGALEREARAFFAERAAPEAAAKRCELLAEFLFDVRGFAADGDLRLAENLFPDAILERRRGYCLGLTLIILDLGERLGWPLAGGAAPRHVFVRYAADPPVNFETTLRGESHSDAWYRDPAGARGTPEAAPVESLTRRQLGAHLINNHGFLLLEQGNGAESRKEFLAALELFPGLVEASMNLGVAHAREKRFDDALLAFDAVLSAWRNDPYARLNRASALASAGRARDAVAEIEKLLATHPRLPELAESVERMRAALNEARAWAEAQAVTVALHRALAAEQGVWPGIPGSYFRDEGFEDCAKTRVDADISFRWRWESPLAGVPRDHFAVRWQGLLEIPAADHYTFFVTCSDGVRLWVDGRLVVDSWMRANDNVTMGEAELIEGLHDFRVDYFEYYGEAGIKIVLAPKRAEFPLPLASFLKHLRPAKEVAPKK